MQLTGTIKKLIDRGFGFVSVDGDGARGSHWFHAKHVADGATFESLRVGQRVSFDSVQSPKGLEAHCVRPIAT